MLKRFTVIVAAAMTLSGCLEGTGNTTKPTPTPTVTPTPTPWLQQEPMCSGSITRAEWLVCDNKTLNQLHHQLAAQWEMARRSASPERLDLLENQLYALLSELDLCDDVPCVDKAYRRYLDAPPRTFATATPKPTPKGKSKPKKIWKPQPWRDGLQNCTRDAGPGEARQLSQRCKAVTYGSNSLCSAERSCATLENLIDKGCRTSRHPPEFCPR